MNGKRKSDLIYYLFILKQFHISRFKNILFNHYTNVHGALLVYDIHDRKSYDAAKEWAVKLKAKVSQCPPFGDALINVWNF